MEHFHSSFANALVMNGIRGLFESLSIHGIKHIFAGYGSKFSRFFWTFAVMGSFVGFGFSSHLLYMKLNTTPDINVRVGQKFTNQIPFPAITICNPLFTKNQIVQFFNISKYSRYASFKSLPGLNLTVEQQNYLASNIHACTAEFSDVLKSQVENRTNNDIISLMKESSLTVNEAIINCGYRNQNSDCSKLFNKILTDKGYCYSFNMQGFNTIFNEKVISKDFYCFKRTRIAKSLYVKSKLHNETVDDVNDPFQWSLDNGYAKLHNSDAVPVKAEKGKFLGFNPYLKENDSTNVCTQIGNVYSFYFHLPNEIMLPVHQEVYVEFRKKKDMILTAKSYTADEGMRKFSPISRGCYFEGEKQLKFFKTYTKALCEFECMTNYTLNVCGCVKFSMPRTSNTPICMIDKMDCYSNAMTIWPDYEKAKNKFEATCGCLKTCNDIKYEIKFEKTSSSENVMMIFDVLNLSRAYVHSLLCYCLMSHSIVILIIYSSDAVSRLSFLFDDFEIVEYEEYASYKLQNCKMFANIYTHF